MCSVNLWYVPSKALLSKSPAGLMTVVHVKRVNAQSHVIPLLCVKMEAHQSEPKTLKATAALNMNAELPQQHRLLLQQGEYAMTLPALFQLVQQVLPWLKSSKMTHAARPLNVSTLHQSLHHQRSLVLRLNVTLPIVMKMQQ
ncbi:uncharacterized protein RB166_012418 [Leptodactylus fuscus]